jgi:DNA topoisomerase-1
MACTGYPECKSTRKIVMKEGQATAVADELLDEKCPVCGNQLIIKHGRFGAFTACSNYPECKYVKRETLGISCPEKGCSGEIVVRKTKRGKTFYGCTRYPDCKFTAWDKPVAEVCPECGSPILVEKFSKSGGTTRSFPNEACKYEHALV